MSTASASLTKSQVARRGRVIEAALSLGADGGYDAVQMRDVATTAGVALGTIYLLGGEPAGNRVRGWLVALSGLCVGIVLFAPTKSAVSGHELPTGRDVFDAAPRILA